MTRRTLSHRARWAVPVVATGVVAGAVILPSALASPSTPDLPAVTADELVQQIAAADPVPLSGTVVLTTRLGLPDLTLPSSMQGAGPIDLLGGSSTVKLWTDGEGRSRASLLGELSEYTVVHDEDEAWTYSSTDNEAVHYAVAPEDRAAFDELRTSVETLDPAVVGDVPTPQEVAETLLAEARSTSEVTMEPATEVAGRAAYQVGLDPTGDGTLVDRVLVAIDAETSVPLRVQVWSVQDTVTPAVEIAFTDVSFDAADPAVFDFTAPPGATVKEVEVPLPDTTQAPTHDATAPGVTVSGTGWETVVELADVDVPALLAGDVSDEKVRSEMDKAFGSDSADQLYTDLMGEEGKSHAMELDAQALFDQLTTTVPEGQIISSSLLTILITEDGRVLAGAVPAETLQALAR